MRSAGVVLAVVAVCLLGRVVPGRAEEENLKEECSNDFEKVVSCFAYATGKAAAPTEECCDSIEGIKESKPKCLCFFIQQTHNGNQQIKSLGIQEIKLLQLPSVCHLKNSSVSYCPSNFSSTIPLSFSFLHQIYIFLGRLMQLFCLWFLFFFF